ncbi:SGNH/GDSL hydrolase family protein [Streptomyces endophyticus]|uniref:SGNH hydrolase n=1 Tax=Streptomyces endophyticus TaxID=714166 RepID=A0ABU6F3I8_9ACTN|nr:GDSL-type esterase/lipase family protein [Streptomyces endophyticus]MEB8337471.1 SGNH hydrolase [Streptomyces endophyticus]
MPRIRTITTVAAAVLALAGGGLAGAPHPAEARPGQGGGSAWFTSWAQSQQDAATGPLRDQSVRTVTHLSQGGDGVRVRIQNTFGTAPLEIGGASVGLSGDGASIKGDTHPVRFDGKTRVTVPAGGEVWSDAGDLRTAAQDDVAVSVAVKGPATAGQHRTALRTNYLTPEGTGDHTADTSGAAYTKTVDATYLVSAVDVRNPRLKGTSVAYGSSVVDGVGSTNCGPGCTETGTNRRWTDDLARRVHTELPPTEQVAIANAGISGTTSAADCPGTPSNVQGLDAASRLKRDVLALHGVTSVLYYYGTNDLAFGCDGEQILASYKKVFKELSDAGINVYVTPITPRPGYTDQNNLDRHTVNLFTKKASSCAGTCDGVMDFDEVLKDPLHPNSIEPSYGNGDGVHANIAGQQAIADSISLRMLTAGLR